MKDYFLSRDCESFFSALRREGVSASTALLDTSVTIGIYARLRRRHPADNFVRLPEVDLELATIVRVAPSPPVRPFLHSLQ
ncbi:hypothetical protein ZHAS_00014459 [Anopheles sinensis]|uniref:Uncharacterized protein n=1 Tax=Anopheles sinensis TaxID=74873 RepID=A0A084W8D0_ANOSI|nr:hypothetical protein ZHAS_00014459 [Anopheles sinensis]